MRSRPLRLLTLTIAALGLAVPAAGAATLPLPSTTLQALGTFPVMGPTPIGSPVLGPCSGVNGGDVQGPPGSSSNQVCIGAGLSFIGPAIGQIATVIGPTIIGPAFVGSINVTAGNAIG